MRRRINQIFRGVEHYFFQNKTYSPTDGLWYWREKIFGGLMLAFLIFGTIAIIPNLAVSIKEQTHVITISDLIVYFMLLGVTFIRRIPLRAKIIIIIVILYTLSIILLVILGPMGPGLIWMASTSLIAALLLGLWASVSTILINITLMLALAFAIHMQWLDTIFFNTYDTMSWIAIGSNVIIFNSLTAVPLALLLNALERSINSETKLKKEVIEKNKQLNEEKIKAENADRLKSVFLANLSHDIRTPMNAIMGFSELLHSEFEEHPRSQSYTEQILKNSNYLNNLIKDIVDISLIESGQVKFELRETALKKLIDDCRSIIEHSQPLHRLPELKLFYELESVTDNQMFMIDSGHTKQVLINLISNAIKYTQKGSIRISLAINDKQLLFKVSDNGIGIPQSEQHKIFSRFSKINRPANKQVPGIGLGLSICKALTQAMGGSIGFNSVEGRGSTFWFSIPAVIQKQGASITDLPQE